MPVENEIKLILRPGTREEDLAALPGMTFDGRLEIVQGYLGGRCRIRKTVHADGAIVYEFGYKCPTARGRIEIETEIGPEDFASLMETATRKVRKTRTVFFTADGISVEFDQYGGSGEKCYLSLVEVEFDDPAEVDRVERLLGGLVLARIPQDDPRFNSYRLSDRRRVEGLIAELSLEATA